MPPKTRSQLYLEKLQERVYCNGMGINKDDLKNGLLELNRDHMNDVFRKKSQDNEEFEEYKLRSEYWINDCLNKDLPSCYENPINYTIMLNKLNEIENSAKHVLKDEFLPKIPLIGTLPTGRLNAMTISVPSCDESIIIFEDQIFTFALLLSKALALALPHENKNGQIFHSFDIELIRNHIDNNPECVERFREVILSYLFLGQPGLAQPYAIGLEESNVVEMLIESCELFIFGHEYGHLVVNPSNKKETTKSLLINTKVESIIKSWDEEFLADLMGLELMMYCMKNSGFDLSLSFIGADFFFSCIDIFNRSLLILKKGMVVINPFNDYKEVLPVDSHPPAYLRRDQLRKYLKEDYGQNANAPIQLAQTIQDVLELLLLKIQPEILYYNAISVLDPSYYDSLISNKWK